MKTNNTNFTEDDLDACWPSHKTYLVEILNGEYNLKDARDDLRSLINTKYDTRKNERTQ